MTGSLDVRSRLAGTAGTAEYVALHAAERPEAVAFIDDDQAITYAQFNRDIGKFTAALRDLALPQGCTVAIGCLDLYTHWLLLLALEQLNVAAASFHRLEASNVYADLLAGVHLVLTDEQLPHVDPKCQLMITPEWVRQARAREPVRSAVRAQQSPNDILRIVRSSGTTGRPKRIAYTRRMHELRVARDGERYQFTQDARYLATLGFSIGPHYGYATACVWAGGCVVATKPDVGVFGEFGITHVGLTPHILKQILDRLPADFVKPASLTISCAGSPLSDEVAERALRSLATEVIDSFGTNEIGGITFKRASLRDSFATVCPGVEVEVVDESGRPLPSGRPGRLRVRSESLVDGYLEDPETTRQFFQDGWFYPSDIAVLEGPRRLKLIGRADEIITTVGGKYAPSDLEARVIAHLGEGDVGVCAFADRDHVETVCVAIAGTRLKGKELLARVEQAFSPVVLGRFRVVTITAIPRNAAGKIERAQLKAAVARQLSPS